MITFTTYEVTRRNTRTGKTTRATFETLAKATAYADYISANPPIFENKSDVYIIKTSKIQTSYETVNA